MKSISLSGGEYLVSHVVNTNPVVSLAPVTSAAATAAAALDNIVVAPGNCAVSSVANRPNSLWVFYTQGDSDVISMPVGFRRHLVGKTRINVFHYDIGEIRFVGKLVIKQTFS